jgi:hypothetical protein
MAKVSPSEAHKLVPGRFIAFQEIAIASLYTGAVNKSKTDDPEFATF